MITWRIAVLVGAGLLGLGSFDARADVVVIVSARSPAASMSKAQVSDIFLGKSSMFPGGGVAVPIDQTLGAAPREEFHAKVTEKTGSQLKFYWARRVFEAKGRPPREVKGDEAVRRLVADSPNAIGYVERNAVDNSVKVVLEP